MPEINSFKIDVSDLGASATSRQFSVGADVGAEFTLQVVNNSGAFYNWKTLEFSAGHTPEKNLRKKLTGKIFNGSILFPASSSATYNFILLAAPDTDTVVSDNIITGSKNVVNKSITQKGDSTVTLAAATANTASYGNASSLGTEEDPPAANVTSTGSPTTINNKTRVNNTWNLYNRKTAANGFGLRLTRQPVDTDWYFTTQDTVNGAVSSSTTVVLDDLTDIVVGMFITAVSSGSLSGTPTITNIDAATKTLTMSAAQTFADGITLTFQARGFRSIKKATGLDAAVPRVAAKTVALEKTVRASASSSSIPVTDTYGISGGSHVTVTGFNINTSGTNDINSVTEDFDGSDTDGVIVMDLSSSVFTGQVLRFSGSTTQVIVEWTLDIKKYPSSSRTIYLNLDNFITPGTAS